MAGFPIISERLLRRLDEFHKAQTPEDMSYVIWTQKLKDAIGSRASYRNSFINWVKSYKEGIPPTEWGSYKTPTDLAEGIWQLYLDNNSDDKFWFDMLRATLIEWIENYAKQPN